MSAPNVISTASLSFGGATYKVVSIPSGRARTVDAIDVTTCSDSKKQFVSGSLITNSEITIVIAGDTPPAINTAAAMSITVGSSSVDCGQAVCKSIEPATVDTTTRHRTWSCVFQALGEAPDA